MESDDNPELERLRAIGAWMRETGVSEFSLGDLRIKLGSPPRPSAAEVSDEVAEPAEQTEEERRLAALSVAEREHYKYWRRLTRSSGAPIPPFKPSKGATQ